MVASAVAVASLGFGASTQHGKQTLPHHEEIVPGVHAAGFSYQFGNANCGWVVLGDQTLLIDLPRGTPVPEFLVYVEKTTGKPAKTLALTNIWQDVAWTFPNVYNREKRRWLRAQKPAGPDKVLPVIEALVSAGITRIVTSARIAERLAIALTGPSTSLVEALHERTSIGDASRVVEFIPLDRARDAGAGAVYLPGEEVLFGGPLVHNGNRAKLAGHDTAEWIAALADLERRGAKRVVPGFGTWDGPESVLESSPGSIVRFRRVLTELRNQVSHEIAKGHSLDEIQPRVRLPFEMLYWTTHTGPRADQIEHVYRELTVPNAPFADRIPSESDRRPHALVLIGDSPHPPAPIEKALRPVFEATGVVPHFTFDVRALNRENLSKVELFVILRDGRQVPRTEVGREKLRVLEDPLHGEIGTWMTLAQEQAVVEFVAKGGAFLNLHNSLGLYPPAGPYLKLVGGRYIGHGPYERFRVEVADRRHPITEGVNDFTTPDEQHTPIIYDESQVSRFLNSRMDNGTVVPAGWTREVGRGRVCHLASGHPLEPLLHPMYQRLMRNAVEWLLRER
jgi:hypothetical protein